MIHAGDFCHGASNHQEFVRTYNDFHIKSYHCIGNHDADGTSIEEVIKYYNMPNDYYYFDCKGYRIIVLNSNYYYDNGKYYNYSLGNNLKHSGDCWDYIPPEQLSWFEKTVQESKYPCIIISHHSIERDDASIKNRKEVLEIINSANKRKSGSVILCINGHYHRDYIRILDNVVFFDMNSVQYDYVRNAHNCYPEELHKKYSMLDHSICYNDPLFAIVTVEGNTITIDGKESSFYMGVTHEMTGNDLLDWSRRPSTARIQSAKIKIGD